MKRIWPILFGLLLLAAPTAVQAQFTYTTNNGAITLDAYTGAGGAVVISNFVTSIGDSAFLRCTSLTSVTIPGSVTGIGADAFFDCTGLTNLAIPASVTNIGVEAFEECTSLASVVFCGNAPIADSTVFAGDNNATVYHLPGTTGWSSTFSGLAALQVTPAGSFNCTTNAGAITITGYTGSGGAVVIPPIINGLLVTSIGAGAFLECARLTSVTIPASVTNIGNYAFYDCNRLTSIMIPASVTSIGDYVFEWCSSLTNITIPGSVTNIGDYAFWGTGLASVTIPNCVTSIGDAAFGDCGSLQAITVAPQNPYYSSVAGVLFDISQTTLLQYPAGKAGSSYDIPNTVTNIGVEAFFDCTGLASVTIPKSVTSIGEYSFWGTGLASVTIPGSVTSIGDLAFAECNNLTNVYFAGNAPAADSSVFLDDNATVYYLPGTTGWSNTFGGILAAELQSPYSFTVNADETITINGYTGPGGTLAIPATIIGLPVTSIGDWAFYGSANLSGLTIPGSVTSIGDYAFQYCTSLTSLLIPNSVTTIGSEVFADCTSLTSVTIPGSVTSLANDFFGCTNLTSVTIENGVTSIANNAFIECFSLASMTIPGSVTNIGDSAFTLCQSMTAITVNAQNAFYRSLNGVLFDKGETTLVAYPGGRGGGYTIPNGVTIIADDVSRLYGNVPF
jgi:hypothetical protein